MINRVKNRVPLPLSLFLPLFFSLSLPAYRIKKVSGSDQGLLWIVWRHRCCSLCFNAWTGVGSSYLWARHRLRVSWGPSSICLDFNIIWLSLLLFPANYGNKPTVGVQSHLHWAQRFKLKFEPNFILTIEICALIKLSSDILSRYFVPCWGYITPLHQPWSS